MLLRQLFIVSAITFSSFPAAPPPPQAIPVTTNYFGQQVVDRYQYFENLKNPAVQKYIRRQADYTNAVLSLLGPGREKIRADVTRLSDAGSAVSTVVRVNDRIFYLERPPGANDQRLMVKESATAAPRMLLDPDALAKETGSKAHLSISNVLPSFDGTYVAVGIVPGGAEINTHLRFVNTSTGTLLRDDIPRAWGGPSGWTPDGKTVFYNQSPELKPGESQNDAELRSIAYRHTLGSTTADTPVFGIGIDPNVALVPTDLPFVATSPVSPYAVGLVAHGVQNELTLYAAPLAAFTESKIPWRKIADVNDDVTSFDFNGSTLYLQNHKNASRYQVTAIDLSKPDQTAANAAVVVSPSETVIQQIAVAKDGLYVRGILGGLANLRKVAFSADGKPQAAGDVKLPFDGTLQEFATDGRVPGAVLGLVSWTKPLLVYASDSNGALTDTGIVKPPRIDTSQYTSIEVKSQSDDGTQVPLSIIIRRGTKLDGTHPAFLEAYGAYGFDIDPYFLGQRLAWLDQGGIYAVSHVRGGGEYGEDWHVAGKMATKQHTIDDAVGAARYLVAQKYTSPAHLAIEGTSAGGIMVGGAITQHPELFAAALDVVGETNPLRSEAADPNGAVNTPEFGSPKTEEGFKALYAMDPYQHIVNGRKYPAVMAVTGINDPRVAPWHPAKFVARLQEASTSGRPVLLRVDYDAGHGMLAASRAQRIALTTDEFSFLLWQTGNRMFSGVPVRIPRTTASRSSSTNR